MSSKDTFHNFKNFNLYYYVSLKFDFILKVSLEKTSSTILPILIYIDFILKVPPERHLLQFQK